MISPRNRISRGYARFLIGSTQDQCILPLHLLPPPRGLVAPSLHPPGFRLPLLSQDSPTFNTHDSSSCFTLCKLRNLSLRSTPVCSSIIDGIPANHTKPLVNRPGDHQTSQRRKKIFIEPLTAAAKGSSFLSLWLGCSGDGRR